MGAEERQGTDRPAAEAPHRRILVLANETCAGRALFDEIAYRAGAGGAEVRIVAPALTSRLRYWVSDEDRGIAEAQERLAATLERCVAAGIAARGEVGDPDPLQALDDAMRTYAPDEVVIATHPPGRSNWLEAGLVGQARARFPETPITHVVVDLEHETATLQPPEAEPPPRREHSRRDVILIALVGVLTIVATFGTITFYALDVAGWVLITWVIAVDFGTKLVAMWLVWMLFQRRARADRLNF